ncbi:putative regulatory protein, FmdB family [Thermosyntropha lipolytica DSM 11003]|uniref:Putative regulatory protein, FmdB family n=1 Tax=Thermosyntropha lipolytica DSM 11003 TaxID=1123382 RepID=A0A1M5KFI5_9FIRM|nr:FmdB family zinc ribbon protein [Thermosyntropha lipolytica]SHG51606.1 putative regulatory protein, FmdB family [Thermosyntropha lipolytica DSM 11003]
MPIYDYRCENCGKFEIKQRITEDPLASCPTCGGKVERLIGKNIGIVFKGSGFYTTDTRMAKDRARQINQERQKDNQALLDGDIKSYVEQAEKTDINIKEA